MFRDEVRAWLAEHLPDGWATGVRPQGDDWRAFCAEWDARTPRRRLGGADLAGGVRRSRAVAAARRRCSPRSSRARVRPIQPPLGGEILVGPTILYWGDDAQKQRYLPPIARGEEIWAQGFSEPGAGSDLASLCTTGRVEGDELVLDGHKIWTSQAQEADFLFLLARTDPDAAPHRGHLVPARAGAPARDRDPRHRAARRHRRVRRGAARRRALPTRGRARRPAQRVAGRDVDVAVRTGHVGDVELVPL